MKKVSKKTRRDEVNDVGPDAAVTTLSLVNVIRLTMWPMWKPFISGTVIFLEEFFYGSSH